MLGAQRKMSKNKKTAKPALQNASEIIERFGGIRPMAAKIDTPVTTVQGWKKRNVIPATRRADVLKAAKDNNIDLSEFTDGTTTSSIANENNLPPPQGKNKRSNRTR